MVRFVHGFIQDLTSLLIPSSVLDGVPAGSGYPPAEARRGLLERRLPAVDPHLLLRLLRLLPARRRPRHQQPPRRRSAAGTRIGTAHHHQLRAPRSWTRAQQEQRH